MRRLTGVHFTSSICNIKLSLLAEYLQSIQYYNEFGGKYVEVRWPQ